MVLFFWAKHFFLGFLLKSLSTQIFFLVVLLCLVLSMTSFCYEHFFRGLCWSLFFTRMSVLSDSDLYLYILFFTTFIVLLHVRVFLFFPLAIFSLSACTMLFRLGCCRAPFSLLIATFWRSFPRPSSTQLFYFVSVVVFWVVCRAGIYSLSSFFS